ncbi:MAG: glycosyltransferase family 2 protein [Actinobacteria bacterium]|nr:glycosyltransferase family 2 protein [Actinomycetota bacterium]
MSRPAPASPEFVPVRMDDVDLAAPLPRLRRGGEEGGTVFDRSLCLVRLHGTPLGTVEADLPADGLAPADLARQIEAELGTEVARHLREDGIEERAVDPAGFGELADPPCRASRRAFLADPPPVSVLICTRDRTDSVRTTLNSLLACDYPASRYEVVVVDNASADESLAAMVAAEFSGREVPVRVEPEPEPGLSHARNKGVATSAGDLVLFADDDVLLDREWIAALAEPFADPGVGATSGMTLPDVLETPTQRWVEGFGGRARVFDKRVFDLAAPPADRPLFPFTIGEFGAGRNMAFRRAPLLELGGFDVALGPGTIAHDGDDVEALLRVLLAGWKIVHDPAAIVWHAHPRDYEELEDRVFGYGAGLTATLTRALLDHPALVGDLLRKLPRGVSFALASDSDKNAGRQGDFPRRLVWRELGGIAYGPAAYARSRFDQRRRARRRAAREVVR